MNYKALVALIMVIVNAIAAVVTAWLHMPIALIVSAVFFFVWIISFLKDYGVK